MADQTETEPEPLLDLDTLIERPSIAIDGERYEMLSPDELSVADHHRFAAWGRRIDKLMAKASLGKKEERELGKILSDLSGRILVGVPDELAKKLTDAQRMQVAEVFTRLPLQKRLKRIAAGAQTAAERPGAKSSPGSSDSTAPATPDGGSPAAPSPCSARSPS